MIQLLTSIAFQTVFWGQQKTVRAHSCLDRLLALSIMARSLCSKKLFVALLVVACSRVMAQTCTDTLKNGQETDKDCGGPVCAKCLTARNCLANSDCLSGRCTSGKCQEPPQCYNGIKDRREVDVDCGGGECYAACASGSTCANTWDCRSRVCTNGICQQPASCANGIWDEATEGAKDCGEMCNRQCGVASTCRVNADCISNVCTNGKCLDAPTCLNGVKDAKETDVDCGGGGCSVACVVGQSCSSTWDCISRICGSDDNCEEATATCYNGIKDQRETGVDCGGGGCLQQCARGDACVVNSDCTSGVCTSRICRQPPTCTNQIKDANEGDTDCGEVCDRQCGVSSTCQANADCISNVCSNGRCVDAPTCKNGVKDAKETDIDCGGGGCGTACSTGRRCAASWDCKSKICTSGVCQQLPTCTNNIWDTAIEAARDCGELCNRQCPITSTCRVDADCLSDVCANDRCADAATCTNGRKDGFEAGVDCGGGACSAPCRDGEGCTVNSECTSNICTDGVCIARATCTDGIKNGQESDVDCGGPDCPPCLGSRLCWQNSDCMSMQCLY